MHLTRPILKSLDLVSKIQIAKPKSIKRYINVEAFEPLSWLQVTAWFELIRGSLTHKQETRHTDLLLKGCPSSLFTLHHNGADWHSVQSKQSDRFHLSLHKPGTVLRCSILKSIKVCSPQYTLTLIVPSSECSTLWEFTVLMHTFKIIFFTI